MQLTRASLLCSSLFSIALFSALSLRLALFVPGIQVLCRLSIACGRALIPLRQFALLRSFAIARDNVQDTQTVRVMFKRRRYSVGVTPSRALNAVAKLAALLNPTKAAMLSIERA